MGGANIAIYLFELIRMKVAAIILGPAGIGLLGNYQLLLRLSNVVVTDGVKNSGIRQIARCEGDSNPEQIAIIVKLVRRLSILLAVVVSAILLLGKTVIDSWLFLGQFELASTLFLSIVLVMGAVSGGNLALIQGTRQMKDLAITQVMSAGVSMLICILLYACFGTKGIVPGLVVSAFALLYFSSRSANKIYLPHVTLNYGETAKKAKKLLSLSVAIIWGGILVQMLDGGARAFVIRDFGLYGSGLYQAAWSISGLFAGFVIAAMGGDFYPRLSAQINDKEAATAIVNHQTEVGILLVLPGLTLTISFAEEILRFIYSNEFIPAAELLRYFALGIFGRVLSWPLGFIQLAKGESRLFLATETIFGALYLGGMAFFLNFNGLHGIGLAFALNYALYAVTMLWVSKRLIGFRWFRSTAILVGQSSLITATVFSTAFLLPAYAKPIGFLIFVVATVLSIRGLTMRLGDAHPLTRKIIQSPNLRRVFCIR